RHICPRRDLRRADPGRGRVCRAAGLEIPGRRHDIPALALDRLDEDRGHAVGRDLLREQLLLDPRHAAHRAGILAAAVFAAIAVAVRDVMYLKQEWRKAGAVHGLTGRETEAPVAASVKGAQESD